MLKKKICKKCREEFGINGWREYDELTWKERRMVCCPSQYSEIGKYGPKKTTGKPPKNCPYYLENIL